MKTVVILEIDKEVSTAWASYLSQEGFAVFTAFDTIEAAEIITMIKVDAVVISSDDPGAFLLLGKAMKPKNNDVSIVTVSKLDRYTIAILLENERFASLANRFTYRALAGAVTGSRISTEVTENALV